MADGNFRTITRPLALTDILIGADPAVADLAAAGGRDTLANIFLRNLRAFPTDLTTAQRAAIRNALSIESGGTGWNIGAAAPSGGSDGMFYLRTGATNPGIYYRAGGSWSLVLSIEPGTDEDEVNRLIDAAQRVLLDAQPSADTLSKLILHTNTGELFITERGIVAGTPARATFGTYTQSNYLGVSGVDNWPGAVVGNWYFNRNSFRPRVLTDLDPTAAVRLSWGDVTFGLVIPPPTPNYLGEFADDDAAQTAPGAVVGSLYFKTSQTPEFPDGELRRVATVIPAVAPQTVYNLDRVATAKDIGRLREADSEIRSELQTTLQSLADEGTQRAQGDDFQSVMVSTISSYNGTLDSQRGSPHPLILSIGADISGTRGGSAVNWAENDILFFAPLSDAAEFLFNLGVTAEEPVTARSLAWQTLPITSGTAIPNVGSGTTTAVAFGSGRSFGSGITPDESTNRIELDPGEYIIDVALNPIRTSGSGDAMFRIHALDTETPAVIQDAILTGSGHGMLVFGLEETRTITIRVNEASQDGGNPVFTTGGGRITITRVADASEATGGSAIGDNSLLPVKARANTEQHKREWRERFASANISAGTTLPALSTANDGDVRIITQSVTSGLSFVDITDPSETVTSARSGDVIMVLTLRTRGWIRVGNIIQGGPPIDALRERIELLEPLTIDLNRVIDGATWANALAADAQFAYSQNLTNAGVSRLITNNNFDPATDLTTANFATSGGSVLWSTARTVPADRAILVRVRKGLDSIQFRTDIDAKREVLWGYQFRATDTNWDYYYAGNSGSGDTAVAVQRRSAVFHTAFLGELGGRALAQVEALIDVLSARIANLDRNISIDPDYWLRDTAVSPAPRTLIVHVPGDALPAGTTHLEFDINSVRATARAEVEASGAYSFTIASTGVANISRLAGSTGTVEINFYDAANGGNNLGHVRDLIRLVREAPAAGPEGIPDAPAKDATEDKRYELEVPTASASTPRWVEAAAGAGAARQSILRAVGPQTSSSGVTSLQLPANYATYEYFEWITGATSNVATSIQIRTDWLAAQQDGDNPKIGVLDAEEAGSRNWFSWTPSTRTLAIGGQSTGSGQQTARINYARLFDPAGAKGDKGDKGDQGDVTVTQMNTAIAAAINSSRANAFTTQDETKLDSLPTFTRYANEAAVPANVPSGTIGWFPEA